MGIKARPMMLPDAFPFEAWAFGLERECGTLLRIAPVSCMVLFDRPGLFRQDKIIPMDHFIRMLIA